jgi:hypothetical protein
MPSQTPNQSSSQTASQGSPGLAQQGQQAQQGSSGGGSGDQGYANSYRGPTNPNAPVIDKALEARHNNLEAALHGERAGAMTQDIYWSGRRDQIRIAYDSIAKTLLDPPDRPTSDEPPASAGAKKAGG